MRASGGDARAPGRRARLGPNALAWLLALGPFGCAKVSRLAPAPPSPGAVKGKLVLTGEGVEDADLPSVVVYLEGLDDTGRAEEPGDVVTVRHTEGSFSPDLLAVGVGQTVRFSNENAVYHRIFSSSAPNAFDLGPIETGGSREVELHHQGVVRIYCSLHPWESGVIFVAPSPHFRTVKPPGSYEIEGVPPGRYRLATWGETLPSSARVVTVEPGQSASIELPIEGDGATP